MSIDAPWLNKREVWEVNPSTGSTTIRVNVVADFNVEIDKLYGPLAAHAVRIRLELSTAEWVVEREEIDGSKWIEMARWDCQIGFDD